ncbi:MAG: TonB-dependent receptor domain-containing protein [Bacteroidota bacterium]
MMLRTSAIFFTILAFIFSLNKNSIAQTSYQIAGQVLEADSGSPLPGATVIIQRDDQLIKGTTTSVDGRFLLQDVSAGPATLTIRFLGFDSISREVTLNRDLTGLEYELEPATNAMTPVEIIGSSPTIYRKMPGTATELKTSSVEMINPVGTQELLRYVPGVTGFSDDGIGNSRISVGVRGLNPRRSSRTLVMEDGIPIQPAIYVYPNMYYNPPAERIDELEMIKSSAAIEYGPQTMGGVINYITRRPRNNFGGMVQSTGGTNSYASFFTEVGGFGTQSLQPEFQLLYKRGDGFRQNNDFEQFNGTFKLNIVPDSNKIIYVKGNLDYENSNATYTGLTEYSFRTNPTFNPKQDDNFEVFRAALDVIYTHQISKSLTGHTRAYVNYFDRDWWREDDVFVRASEFQGPDGPINPVPPYTPGNLIRTGNNESNFGILRSFYVAGVQQSYDINHTMGSVAGEIEVGGRLHWERFIDDRKQGFAEDARDGVYYTGNPEEPSTLNILGQSHHYETRALSLFGSDELRWGNIAVRYGARFEIFEQSRIDRLRGSTYLDKTSWVFLPGLGFNHQWGPINLFGGIHRGYTPPSSGTLKIVNFGSASDDTGLDLEPEKSWNKELGVRTRFDVADLELTGFHIGVQDLVAAGRGTAFKNLGRVNTWGLETSANFYGSQINKWLPDLHGTYTFMQTRIENGIIISAVKPGNVEVSIAGNELPYAPDHQFTVGLSKQFDFGLTLRSDLRYVGSVYTDFENIEKTYNRGDTGPVPSYHVIDASARYIFNRHWELQLTGKNITDEIFIGSRLHSNPGQPSANLSSGILPGPRRQVNLQLRYRF